MTKTSKPTKRPRFNVRRDSALFLFVFLLLTPLWPLVVLVLLICASVFLIRFTLSKNRTAGISLIAILTIALVSFAIFQYIVEQKVRRLTKAVEEYPDVSIGRVFLPFPSITRLSIGTGVNDDELETILNLDGLENIVELHLDCNDLTDNALLNVAARLDLEFIFIDCDKITDQAIIDFQDKFPECRVIPFQRRHLFDNGIRVNLGPLHDEE